MYNGPALWRLRLYALRALSEYSGQEQTNMNTVLPRVPASAEIR